MCPDKRAKLSNTVGLQIAAKKHYIRLDSDLRQGHSSNFSNILADHGNSSVRKFSASYYLFSF